MNRLQMLFAVCVLPLAFLSAASTARGQDARLKIGHLEKLAGKAAEVVDVTLDGPMLRLAAKFISDKEDPEAAQVKELIKNLTGVYVRSFEFDKKGEYSETDVEAVRAQLRAPTWSRVVGVRSKRESENTEVYFMGQPDDLAGLAIIVAEPKELTIVNIVGPVDIDKLSELEGHLGVPKLDLEKPNKPGKKEAAVHEKAK